MADTTPNDSSAPTSTNIKVPWPVSGTFTHRNTFPLATTRSKFNWAKVTPTPAKPTSQQRYFDAGWHLLNVKPPKNGMSDAFLSTIPQGVVLQDDMLAAVLSWDGITKKERGIRFPADLNNKGDILNTREPRGRPAHQLFGTETRYQSWKRSPTVTVPLWGDEGELCYPKAKERNVVDLLTRPILTTSDPTSYNLLALPRPKPSNARKRPLKVQKAVASTPGFTSVNQQSSGGNDDKDDDENINDDEEIDNDEEVDNDEDASNDGNDNLEESEDRHPNDDFARKVNQDFDLQGNDDGDAGPVLMRDLFPRLTRKQTLDSSRQTSLAPRPTKKQRLHSSDRTSLPANTRTTTAFQDFSIQPEKPSSTSSLAFPPHGYGGYGGSHNPYPPHFTTGYGASGQHNLSLTVSSQPNPSIAGSSPPNPSIAGSSPPNPTITGSSIFSSNTGSKSATTLVRPRKPLPPDPLLGPAQEFLASAWKFLQFAGDKFEDEEDVKRVMDFARDWDKFSCQIEGSAKKQ